MLKHTIHLDGNSAKGARIDANVLENLLRILSESMQRSIRYRIEGRSTIKGRHDWLQKAASFELVGITNGSTKLIFEAPMLGDTIPDCFDQDPLFPDLPPLVPTDTPFSVLERIIIETEKPLQNFNIDRTLYKSISQFKTILDKGFKTITFNGQETTTVLNENTVKRANELVQQTPAQQPVVISGILNQLTNNTRSFKLMLNNGLVIKGILPEGSGSELGQLWTKSVTIDGIAVFSPTKSLSHIIANHIAPASMGDSIFESIPRPKLVNVHEIFSKAVPSGQNSLKNIFNRWPGEETEEEILSALKEI